MKIEDMHAEVMRRWDRQQIHDPDFAGLRLLQRPINSVMDVGANAGQSIVSFRVTFPTASIASFEANPMLHASLAEVARRVGGPVSVNRCGLSDANGLFTLHIPHVGDEAFLEEASIRKEYYDAPWVVQKYRERGGLRLVEVIASIRVGDEFGLAPDIIKVDVEGAEASVMRGLRKTISEFHPALLVENSDWHGVAAILDQLGYRSFRYDPEGHKLVPFSGTTANTFYLAPQDQHIVVSG